MHVRARYYEVETGRFVQKDPEYSTTNLYAYCISNPTNAIDISGEVPLIIVVGIIGGIVLGTVIDWVENGELDKPWLPAVRGLVGYIGGAIGAAALGGPGTYITIARVDPIAISVDHCIRGGGRINIRIPPGIVKEQIFRLGLDWHKIGDKSLPHIDLIIKGKKVVTHWPWQ